MGLLGNLWNAAKIAVASRLKKDAVPDLVLDAIKGLAPDKWVMSVNGVTMNVTHETPVFDVVKSARERALVLEELRYAVSGVPHVMSGSSRFRNDGSDKLSIDGVAMKMPQDGYNWTSKPLRGYYEILASYTDQFGEPCTIKFSNQE